MDAAEPASPSSFSLPPAPARAHWSRWISGPMRRWLRRRAPILGLVGLLVAGVAFFGDYGLSWDETDHATYGELVLDYWLSGGADRRAIDESGVLKFYGVIIDLPSAVLHRALGLDAYALRGLVGVLFAAATFPPVWWLGRLLGGRRVGAMTALALILMPPFLGHAFINQKDIPLACGVAWCAWSAALLGVMGRRGWAVLLGAGVAAGFTLGCG